MKKKKLFGHVNLTKTQWLAYGIGVLIALVLPFIFKSSFAQHVLVMITIWSIVGMGWNFLGGYAGQTSTGHAVFYGLGAYTSVVLFKFFGVTPWIGIFAGMLVSVCISVLIGASLLRLRGHYFAVASMAVCECCRIIFVNLKTFGGATGIDFLNKKVNKWVAMQLSKTECYYVFLTFAILVLALTIFLDRSKFGYYLRTIREDQSAAESVGIDTTRYKLMAYMLSAAIVSLGGSLYAQYMLYIDPSMLMTLKISLMILLVTVMGGIGTTVGPIIGAVILTLISELSRAYLGGSGGGTDQIIYGALVIIVVLFLPDGVLSLISRLNGRSQTAKKKAGKEAGA